MALLPPDPLFCLKSDMGHIHNICFISNDSFTTHLLAATEEGYVYLWNLKTNRVESKQKLGTSIQAIHYINPDLITQEKTGLIQLWTVDEKSNYIMRKQFESNGGYCRSIIVNDILLFPHDNSTIVGITVNAFIQTLTLKPDLDKLGYVMCLEKVEIADNLYIAAGYETGDVILWNFLTTTQRSRFKLKEYITSISFDSVIGRGVCGNSSNTLQFFTIDKNHEIKLKCEVSVTNEGCNVVRLRQDRKILACAGWDGRLRLFSWKSLRILVVLNQHRKGITDVKFSPEVVEEWNSKIMAAASADGSISLWSLYN
ncbi:hypothetical protein FQR65_LT13465 [Abscondita terminalis]|nr:hypothetical protein FQR65_LT13465 [Abscondita terminalis]